MDTDSGSDHTLAVPPKTEVAGTAFWSAQAIFVFTRWPFCNELTSVECRPDGPMNAVLECAVTGKLFSIVFETPKRGYGGMQPLPVSRHKRFALPEVEVAATLLEAPLGYVIRAQCPFCDKRVEVVNEKGGDLPAIIKCESTGKAFSVFFPDRLSSLRNADANLTGHA
jgi:hypothetical protein